MADNQTRLWEACEDGELQEVLELLQDQTLDIDVNLRDNYYNYTPLIYACRDGNLEIVELLLNDERVEINLGRKNGSTAFFLACYLGKKEVVELMLKYEGLDVNKANDWGWTPLMAASFHGYFEIVELVLKKRGREIDLDVKNCDGKSVIDLVRAELNSQKGKYELDVDFNERRNNCQMVIEVLEAFKQEENL